MELTDGAGMVGRVGGKHRPDQFDAMCIRQSNIGAGQFADFDFSHTSILRSDLLNSNDEFIHANFSLLTVLRF